MGVGSLKLWCRGRGVNNEAKIREGGGVGPVSQGFTIHLELGYCFCRMVNPHLTVGGRFKGDSWLEREPFSIWRSIRFGKELGVFGCASVGVEAIRTCPRG